MDNQNNLINNNHIKSDINLNQLLNDERMKNQKLEEKIESLKKELNINKQNHENQKNEINSLKARIQQLQKENQKLKENKFNQNNIQNNLNINEINKLLQTINQKDNQIKELQLKLQSVEKKNLSMNDIIVVNFVSLVQSIRTGIQCLAEDTFAEVEEKLYQMYEEYRNTNNILLFQGNTILRFKKIRENKIKNGDTILVKPPE